MPECRVACSDLVFNDVGPDLQGVTEHTMTESDDAPALEFSPDHVDPELALQAIRTAFPDAEERDGEMRFWTLDGDWALASPDLVSFKLLDREGYPANGLRDLGDVVRLLTIFPMGDDLWRNWSR